MIIEILRHAYDLSIKISLLNVLCLQIISLPPLNLPCKTFSETNTSRNSKILRLNGEQYLENNERNNLSASNSPRILSTIYGVFFIWPPSLVIVQTEINTPRSLGACSHLRNCIPTRHIVKLSFLSFSLLWEWGRRRGEGGETKSHSDVCNEHAWMRAEGAPLSPTWKKKEWKKGEKRKRKKKGDPWREREREGELIETGHGRIPSNGSQ